MRYAVDVDLVEIVERRADAGSHEAELEQTEEEQGDDNDRNERENEFSCISHEDRVWESSPLWWDSSG